MRQLISSDDSVPATEQHKAACSDCPWARTALPGWLGALSADDWLKEAHGEADIECHVLTGVQCAGAAIYRANIGKLPRDAALLRLPADKAKVFATPSEFLAHHARNVTAYVAEDEMWVTCPECGHDQADMGNGIQCEECGEGPMPTHEVPDEEED